MTFPYRYIARITVEAVTPLIIGSDTLRYDQDSPVNRDFNNLPYLPGTAIAGFLRSALNTENLFGDEKNKKKDDAESKGSNITVSDGYLLNSKNSVLQTPTPLSKINNDELLKNYENLPLRQHTKINHLGAADEGSKFDQEFVYKGSRFKFEISLETGNEEKTFFEEILNKLQKDTFYLGGGKYNNFGELQVKEIQATVFNLENDLENYLDTSSNLNETLSEPIELLDIEENDTNQIKITLDGSKSFFHFGAGLGDTEVDDTNYKEQVIEGWKNEDGPKLVDKFVIPGTSIKGALAHRTAFYYNKYKKGNPISVESIIENISSYIEESFLEYQNFEKKEIPNNIQELESELKKVETLLTELETKELRIKNLYEPYLGENNVAVATLFGTAKNSQKNKDGQKGTLIIKDIYLNKTTPEVIFTHNKIDRFTQGTIEGALFSEKTLAIKEAHLIIKGEKENFENPYFQMALNDLKEGLLPLGGKTNKGHGVFTLKSELNGKNE